jgi:hypothetical protein
MLTAHSTRLPTFLLFIASLAMPAAAPPAGECAPSGSRGPQQGAVSGTEGGGQAANDLDAFMSRVLARRDENWKKLHDYILSETEMFDLVGPGGRRLDGMRREFMWYVRDGYLVRSPLRFDGVAIAEADRRKYEDKWLAEETAREKNRNRAGAKAAQSSAGAGEDQLAEQADAMQPAGRLEPRFISEAYFLKFKFEAGNYYLVGRERLDGRDVLRIEYYPTRLFGDERERKDREGRKPDKTEERIERDLNKVALVTLWIDPSEFQIVRYTFDNVDFGFLPGRWLVRVDNATASMTMGRVLDGVWLPKEITMHAGVTLANGSYEFVYARQFHDHKKAETSARIRDVRDEEDR